MPVFILLLFVSAAVLWVLLSFVFIPLGRFVGRILEDAKDAMNAETAIVKANAEAEVVRIAAEAEAQANREIASSLAPELIEKIKYEQWDGKVPTVSGSNAIVSIPGIN